MVTHIEGDTVERGSFQGASSWLILSANDHGDLSKVHHIFDSFEGLSEPIKDDGSHWRAGNLAASIDEL